MSRNHVGKTFIEVIKMEFMLFVNSINIWAFIILWFAILVYFCSRLFLYSKFVLGDAFISQGIVTQSLLTGGIILGTILSSKERKEECDEAFSVIPYTHFYKIIAKIFLLMTVGMFIFATGSLAVFVVFSILKAAEPYYIPSGAYILLYWVIPFFISGLIGCILGQSVRFKMVYPLVIFISVLLGPLVPKLVSPFLLTESGSQYQIYMLFNLGDLNLHAAISESLGYYLNKELWIARICEIMGVLLIILAVNTIKGRRKTIYKVVLVIIAITLIIAGIRGANRVVKLQNRYMRQTELIDYYSKNPEPDFGEELTAISSVYDITGYDVSIDDGLKLKICTEVMLNITDDKHPLVFTLFHGFEISKCTIDGRKEMFRVEGDALIVENIRYKTGNHILSLEYEGIPPINLYMASDKWILPGMFAWIPVEYVGKAMANEWDTLAMFNYPDRKKDVPIKVKYLGNNEVFCSLDRKTDNWEGISSGITLACGWFDEEKVGGISVVYPRIYPENAEQAASAMKGLIAVTNAASGELKDGAQSFNADKIFVFPSLLNSYTSSGLYFFKDHIIMCIFFDQGGSLIESMDGRNVVDSVTRTSAWNRVDREVIWIFEYSYLESLSIRNVINGEKIFIPSFDSLIQTIRDDEKRLDLADMAQKIKDHILTADDEKQISFFGEFLELINNGSNVGKITRVINEIIDGETE